MKKVLFATFLFVISFSCHAQLPNFMSIPIDGSLENFDVQLQKRGFEIKTKEDYNEIWYEGECWGHKATIIVYSSPLSNTVYGLHLFFDFDSEQELTKFYESQIKTRFLKYKVDSKYLMGGMKFKRKNEIVYIDIDKNIYRKQAINYISLSIYNNKNWTKAITEKSKMPRVSMPTIEQVHNIKNGAETGMNIKLKFDVKRMKGHTIKAVALFYYEDNSTQLKDPFGNQVSISKAEIVTSKNATLTMTLFIPYGKLNMTPNWRGTLSFNVVLYDDSGNELNKKTHNRFTFSNI